MKVKYCPTRKTCWDYKSNNCDNCAAGDEFTKLHKRIDRLKKQNETLTIERNELIRKLETLLCCATGSKLSKHTYDIRTMATVVTDYINESYDEGYEAAAQEVAREIFELVECSFSPVLMYEGHTIKAYIAEIKKKYTEG